MFSFLVDFNLKTAIVIEIEDICFNPLKKRCAKKKPRSSRCFVGSLDVPCCHGYGHDLHDAEAGVRPETRPNGFLRGQNTRNVDNL